VNAFGIPILLGAKRLDREHCRLVLSWLGLPPVWSRVIALVSRRRHNTCHLGTWSSRYRLLRQMTQSAIWVIVAFSCCLRVDSSSRAAGTDDIPALSTVLESNRRAPNSSGATKDSRLLKLANAVPMGAHKIESDTNMDWPYWRGFRNCGRNSLYAYLRLNGIKVTREEIDRAVPVTAAGSSFESLRVAAEEFGLPSKIVTCAVGDLDSMPKPSIVHIVGSSTSGHYLLFLRRSHSDDGDLVLAEATDCELTRTPASAFSRVATGYVMVPETRNPRASRGVIAFVVVAIIGVGAMFVRTRYPRLRSCNQGLSADCS
jgi:Peptidase C39 family